MPKTAPLALTVNDFVAVAPRAVAVMVTAPTAVPATVAVNAPLPLVVPVAGVMVTLPVPDGVSVTAVPETVLPPASFAVAVRVIVELPSSGSIVAEDVSVTVDPTICTGICFVAVPAVAVIVAVRLNGLLPEEKVKVALPSLPVTAVGALKIPVSVPMVIVTPDRAALKVFNALTVIVEVVESSDFTVVG
jgi:hypothetical protein